jgi:poly(3-hydroxybutyrate) depolymerase
MSLNSTAPIQPSSIALPALGGIAPTVSGLSAGGFMSGNMFTIYSETIVGAGIVAGNPWACQQAYNFKTCWGAANKVSPKVLLSYATKTAAAGGIDSPTNMKGKPVWLFSGTVDPLVPQS